ncbi:hypothetical protein KIM322_14220 [Lactobacillus xylocopicola]|uniref:Uncharacterized protein n=1 Tax=Lactobacillus xylocopicola TaxID=2976676 RepID=A0ABM8BIL6_9LACO|nr:hypothetical protein KIM322_14220 [Lactobacillus xylocopicola]
MQPKIYLRLFFVNLSFVTRIELSSQAIIMAIKLKTAGRVATLFIFTNF